MNQDVNEFSEWVTGIKSFHSPWFSYRSVFNWKARFFCPAQRFFEVINLYRKVRSEGAGTSLRCKADLNFHRLLFWSIGGDPAMIHQHFQSKYTLVKRRCFMNVLRIDICYYSFNHTQIYSLVPMKA